MRTQAEIDRVLDAIREADPDEDDGELQAIYNALRWVAGYEGGSAEQFIRDSVSDE